MFYSNFHPSVYEVPHPLSAPPFKFSHKISRPRPAYETLIYTYIIYFSRKKGKDFLSILQNINGFEYELCVWYY